MTESTERQNRQSLSTLIRAIALSQGQFTPILVRCNYQVLQFQVWQNFQKSIQQKYPSLTLQEIHLSQTTTSLFNSLWEAIENQTHLPQVLVVFGLDQVEEVEQIFKATNQVRDEFSKTFPFPVFFWLTDNVLQKLTRFAPDFKSWAAASVKFELPLEEAVMMWWELTESLFKQLYKLGAESFYSNACLDLAPGCSLRKELEFARTDIHLSQASLSPVSEATWQFILGRDAYDFNQILQALNYYQNSLSLWSRKPPGNLTNPFLDQQGLVLFHIGLCVLRQAQQHPAQRKQSLQEAKHFFQQSYDIVSIKNHQQFAAELLVQIGDVLRQLKDWSNLEKIGHLLLKYPASSTFQSSRAKGYSFLAEVNFALGNTDRYQKNIQKPVYPQTERKLNTAFFYIQEALKLQERITPYSVYRVAKFKLLQAKIEKVQGSIDIAINTLETSRSELLQRWSSEGFKGVEDKERERLYGSILQELRSLYRQKQDYQTAFDLKQEQQLVEQYCGLRAFHGVYPAGSQTLSIGATLNQQKTLLVSGRQKVVDDLVDLLSRSEQKLIILHGLSGVGKTTLLRNSLIPTLQQTIFAAREIVPIIQSHYRNWLEHFPKQDPQESSNSRWQDVIKKLKQNAIQNLFTILIFDQFEEFFFVCTDTEQQQQFYHFFSEAMRLPFVKIIISLREDYLHLLLNLEANTNLAIVNHNLLDRQFRYRLQDLTREETRQAIIELTENAGFLMEPALVTALVHDLSQERGTVRPLELHLVGAQLQEDNIVTLQQYQQLGKESKISLVKRSLLNIVSDCGPENQDGVWLLLFTLTGQNGTRPLKTRSELKDILQKTYNPTSSRLLTLDATLNLILHILVGSKLVLRFRETPEERYQLVHDYLVPPIREQYQRYHNRAVAARLAQNHQELVKVRQQRFKAVMIGVSMAILAGITGLFALAANEQRRLAQQSLANAELLATRATSMSFLTTQRRFDALLEALFAATQLSDHLNPHKGLWSKFQQKQAYIPHTTQVKVVTALEEALSAVKEKNRLMGHQDVVWDVAFAYQDRILMSTGRDRTIKLWNRQGETLATITPQLDSLTSIDTIPTEQGFKLAVSSWDGTVKLWSVQVFLDPNTQILQVNPTELTSIQTPQEKLFNVQFSPQGQTLATSGSGGVVQLWTIQGQLLNTFTGHQGKVRWVNFSPDGQFLATAGEDKTVRLWSVEGEEVQVLQGHQDKVGYVSFSPNGQLLASASDDRTVKLWRITGEYVKTFKGHQDWVFMVNFSPDGQKLVSAGNDGNIRLWSVSGNVLNVFSSHEDGVTSVKFSQDGRFLLSGSYDKTVRLWDLQGNSRVTLRGHQDNVKQAIFSPDGEMLATASRDRTIKLWSQTGALLHTLTGHQAEVEAIAFSPDGQFLVSASEDNTLRLWTRNGQPLQTLQGHRKGVLDVAWESQKIASASRDGTVRIWSPTGQPQEILRKHTQRVNTVALSRTGEWLATAGDDHIVYLWQKNPNTGKFGDSEPLALKGHSNWVLDIDFFPQRNGKNQPFLASAGYDNQIFLWNQQGEIIKILDGHTDSISHLDIHPEGDILATTSFDHRVSLWHINNELLHRWEGHQSRLFSVSWHPNGSAIATASADTTVTVFSLNLTELIQISCQWLEEYLRYNVQVSQREQNLCF